MNLDVVMNPGGERERKPPGARNSRKHSGDGFGNLGHSPANITPAARSLGDGPKAILVRGVEPVTPVIEMDYK